MVGVLEPSHAPVLFRRRARLRARHGFRIDAPVPSQRQVLLEARGRAGGRHSRCATVGASDAARRWISIRQLVAIARAGSQRVFLPLALPLQMCFLVGCQGRWMRPADRCPTRGWVCPKFKCERNGKIINFRSITQRCGVRELPPLGDAS